MGNKGDIIRRLAKNKFRLRLFLLWNLPMGFLAGLKLVSVDSKSAVVSVPFKFLNKNPFHSIYFAVLSMAAELSTGVLGMASVYDAKIPVSMLLLNMRAEFVKKAKTRIFFTCNDGEKITEAINKSIQTKQGEIIEAYAEGYDINKNLVAKFYLEWTFKPKK